LSIIHKKLDRSDIMLKQIIVVSDGKSNTGPNPVEAAKLALSHGIRVNTIGIIDNYEDTSSILELKEIAENGGGICELTNLNCLSETLSRVTMKSVYGTIEEVVSNQLRNMMKKDLDDIRPDMRNKIIELIDRLGDETPLKCLILLDASGSMREKLEVAKRSVYELLMFLEERSGSNHIGVITFPGTREDYELLCEFTDDCNVLKKQVSFIKAGGVTPTGSAIEGAIRLLERDEEEYLLANYIV
jgi:Ca-activated chloride channel family protein